MTRRRSITSLHRLGSVAVQEQFAPVRPHGRRHHSFHGKGKLMAKGVQIRTEGQLKDHTVFPPGNTVSSEPASCPALLGSASGGKHIKAVCERAWKSLQPETSRLGGCPTPE